MSASSGTTTCRRSRRRSGHGGQARAVVRGAGRQQVVHSPCRRRGDRRSGRGAQSHISKGRRGEEEGVGGCACGACRPDLMRRAQKPRMLVAIALANKMARSIWAMLTKGKIIEV